MKLFIVATPIGNLSDISQRALDVLGKVDVVLSEDTRRTGKLLSRFGIESSMESYHYHSDRKKKEKILKWLQEGKDLALVSDAGTPGISDPGGKLIEFLLGEGVDIIPIPGPSAITAALSISGFATNSFVFLGFPPKKNGRKTYFQKIRETEEVVVFFESRYRIVKTLEELDINNRQIVLCQELTKMHETIYRGSVVEVLEKLEKVKGEFVVVIDRV